MRTVQCKKSSGLLSSGTNPYNQLPYLIYQSQAGSHSIRTSFPPWDPKCQVQVICRSSIGILGRWGPLVLHAVGSWLQALLLLHRLDLQSFPCHVSYHMPLSYNSPWKIFSWFERWESTKLDLSMMLCVYLTMWGGYPWPWETPSATLEVHLLTDF